MTPGLPQPVPQPQAQPPAVAPMQTPPQPDPLKKIYDIGVGRYDVAISVGASYKSRREQAAAMLSDIIHAFPQAFPVIGDLLIGNMDVPYAKEMAKRLKAMAPPQVQNADNDPAAQLQQMQTQHAQMQQALDHSTQVIQQLQQQIATKQVENQGRVQIAQIQATANVTAKRMDNITKLAVAEVMTKAQDARQRAEAEMDILQQSHDQAHEAGMAAMGQQHDLELGEQEHQQGLEAADQAHQNATEQQAQVGQQQAVAQAAQQAQAGGNGEANS